MPEESNGHNSPSRMDRIERAIEALIDGHDRLLVSQKQLLTSQVLMNDSLTKLTEKDDKLTEKVDKLTEKVDAHEERIQLLIDSQLRVDETLQYIKKLIGRQSPSAQT